jgi:hypothetical protein
MKAKRETVDLSAYPDLVVIYLGMRINVLSGMKTAFGMGPKIDASVAAKPDGLLLHENILFSLRHLGMRQYWRDFESLEKWSRSDPHRQWWTKFLKDTGGTGFWHETYLRRGGIEAVYVDMFEPVGMGKFAPRVPARGSGFSARARAGMSGEAHGAAPIQEKEFYSE